ncbi:MAG: methyltransferase domain-containing protein [Bryobacteraceae bacterium]
MKRYLAMLVLSVAACAQVATKANENYQTPQGRAGIAAGLDNPERNAAEKPKDLVKAMGIAPGMTVVDLGTGVGYMLPFLCDAVGTGGKVIGEDIQTDFLDKARAKAKHDKLGNVEFILGTATDPNLPADTADRILVLEVYHHFDYPAKMLAHLKAALRPDGELVIVDFYKRRGAMGDGDRALQHIRLDEDGVIQEVEANGFRLISRHEHIPKRQYMAIFGKK